MIDFNQSQIIILIKKKKKNKITLYGKQTWKQKEVFERHSTA